MNGKELEAMEKLFDAKLTPIGDGVKELRKDFKKHGDKLTELDTKFKFVGNCAEHKAEVDNVKLEVGKVSNRMWALVISIIGGAITIVARAFWSN